MDLPMTPLIPKNRPRKKDGKEKGGGMVDMVWRL
jgi:hypothetical protein